MIYNDSTVQVQIELHRHYIFSIIYIVLECCELGNFRCSNSLLLLKNRSRLDPLELIEKAEVESAFYPMATRFNFFDVIQS